MTDRLKKALEAVGVRADYLANLQRRLQNDRTTLSRTESEYENAKLEWAAAKKELTEASEAEFGTNGS